MLIGEIFTIDDLYDIVNAQYCILCSDNTNHNYDWKCIVEIDQYKDKLKILKKYETEFNILLTKIVEQSSEYFDTLSTLTEESWTELDIFLMCKNDIQDDIDSVLLEFLWCNI